MAHNESVENEFESLKERVDLLEKALVEILDSSSAIKSRTGEDIKRLRTIRLQDQPHPYLQSIEPSE